MKAMLRFKNGDRQEITLLNSHIVDGHPRETIHWRDGSADRDGQCEVGGVYVGERMFWLDVPAYRDARVVRYIEAG